ncbi:DUF4040 family protein [Corynebacterium sp. H78]|uniref:DUF4040 family protein n=1 Tax=Corynebacterium sp. H78 TaxID=3133417 RepID=UPI0030ACCA83
MTLLSVPALVACALVLTPLFVKLLDRHAGWPIVAFFIAAVVQLARLAPDVFPTTTGTAGPSGQSTPVTWSTSWASAMLPESIDANFALRLDPLSLTFALLALLVGSVVFIYSTAYLPKRDGTMSFYLLMTAFMLAVVLLVLADDVVLLFIAWELVSMASFLLIARSGSSGEDGSIRTLILTFTGGLFLLAALGIAVWATGTTNVTELLASPIWGTGTMAKPAVTTIVATLVALAAFTKAAQLPFHAWLPEAMAAATPVSAFLHAAAVVKAGIYLLMRFSTAFAHVTMWQSLLLVLGMATAVAAAVFAIQQTDIKKLIAYSTVSQLGWIVATIGVGTRFAITAAVVHTIAHAMFKSSLFMLAGVVDHEAGTRDMRRLGPLWKRMPWTFGSMVLGAASMAAIPPTLGFLSKEGMLEAFTEAPTSGAGVIALLTFAAIGALATFTYSARLIFGVFVDGPRDVSKVHEAPAALWIPAALPGVLSLPVAFFAGSLLDGPLNAIAYVTDVTGTEYTDSHLALWHGVTTPLVISLIVIALGIALIVVRTPLYSWLTGRKLFPFTGVHALNAGTSAGRSVGKLFGKMANSYAPSRHLLPLLGMIAVYALVVAISGGFSTVGGAELAPKVPGIDHPTDLIPLSVVIIGVIATVRAKNRLQAAVLLGVTGTGVTLQIMLLGAPDVAMTQFLVEILTVVLMMLVLRHQPRAFVETSSKRKSMAVVVAAGVGFATFAAMWALTGRRQIPAVGQWYLDNTEAVTGEKNIVNVILVEFRAFDTMGELSVLGMAGIAIAAVVASMPRWPHLLDKPGELAEVRLNTLYPRMLMKWLVPLLFAVSLVVLYRGGNLPGGGFNAALIGAATLMLHYLSSDKDEPVMGRYGPFLLSAGGVIMAIVTGFIGYFKGSFLAPLYAHVLGQHLTTALLFDVGVYLAVMGVIAAALNYLGGSDRPGSEKSDADLSPGVAHRTSLVVVPPQGYEAETPASAPSSASATSGANEKEVQS